MKSHSNRRPSPALIVSVVALLVALGGSAYAVQKNSVRSKNIVNGAVSGKDIRDGAVKGKHVNEGTLSFRCPSGTKKVIGLCFEAASSPAPTRWDDAIAACDVKGGYMPTVSQLVSAAAELGNVGTAGESEWVDSAYEDGGNRKALTVNATGNIAYRQQDAVRPYRCIKPLGL
ncbi:MAG: hypothetical protein WBC01_03440 [Solirubrobacterales bacterium]